MYQQGGTIEDVLDRMASHDYVLPAIQREFVWSAEQICALFDSLMQGYPFGEFLFWRIAPDKSAEYRCYDFVRNYHQRDDPHCPDLGIRPNKQLIAVLDGQQRLTAFNIGLRGSFAVKQPRLWWRSPNAFPRRVLALDLLAQIDQDEEGNRYRFNFIDPNRIGPHENRLWFQVSDILNMDSGPPMLDWLNDKKLDRDRLTFAFSTLNRLYEVVRTKPTVVYYEEKNQDIEHVLNIFIRRNSGGTVLAYSDLLLSVAVSQWDNLDARKEVHALVDELNGIGAGLNLSKDFVLKAGLMLTDIASVSFRVRNFTHANMAHLEKNWDRIKTALTATVQVVTSFGFDSSSIKALSVLLPVAYYLYRLDAPSDFDSHDSYAADRAAIRGWLTRCVLKTSGIWGSDTLLTALRDVLRNTTGGRFPAANLRAVMAQRGKSLDFTEEEIQDLSDIGIADRRVFPLLALLFPFIDLSAHHFHIDHVFPKSRFTAPRLRAAGVEEKDIDTFVDCVNRVGNLQLLDGVVNKEKRDKLPALWIQEHFADDGECEHYRSKYLIDEIPDDVTGFMSFYETRREKLRARIAELLVNSA